MTLLERQKNIQLKHNPFGQKWEKLLQEDVDAVVNYIDSDGQNSQRMLVGLSGKQMCNLGLDIAKPVYFITAEHKKRMALVYYAFGAKEPFNYEIRLSQKLANTLGVNLGDPVQIRKK